MAEVSRFIPESGSAPEHATIPGTHAKRRMTTPPGDELRFDADYSPRTKKKVQPGKPRGRNKKFNTADRGPPGERSREVVEGRSTKGSGGLRRRATGTPAAPRWHYLVSCPLPLVLPPSTTWRLRSPGRVLGLPCCTSGSFDRFTGNAYDFVIEGETYRPRQKPSRANAAPPAAAPRPTVKRCSSSAEGRQHEATP